MFFLKELRGFLFYVFMAGIATAVDMGLLYGLTEFFGVWYLFSAAISYAFGMVTNYSLNKTYTFRNKSRRIIKQFSLFSFVALIGLGLNLLIMYLLVEFLLLWYVYAKIVSVFIVLAWSYSGHRELTFKLVE